MNPTDILIESLAQRGARTAGNKRLAFVLPIASAAIAIIIAMIILIGLPQAGPAEYRWGPLLAKWMFAIPLTGLALAALYTLAHPGRRSSVLLLAALAPLALIAGLGLIEVTGGLGKFPGATWQRCVIAIGLAGILGMAAAIYATRLLAPVRLRRAGFAAGLFGGGLAACAYAPFCPELGMTYLVVFYGGPIAVMAALGWLFGPPLLRW